MRPRKLYQTKKSKIGKNEPYKKEKIEAASKKYINKLYYYDEYMSICCWRNAKQVDVGLATSSVPG